MGTRSRIAVQRDDHFESIYCHWDGYLGRVGKTLVAHYGPFEVDALMRLGDISSLHANLRPANGDKVDFDGRDEDCTKAYADRGEDSPAAKSVDMDALLKLADNCGTEFVYVLQDSVWLATWHGEFRAFGCGPGEDDEGSPWLPLQPVETALAEEALQDA